MGDEVGGFGYPLLSADQIRDEPCRWETLKQEVLGRGAIVTFVNDHVRTPDGRVMERQYGLHPGAVAIVAWNE
ncbi:MAG: hypothetical protein LBU38_03070, partial [Propionibacteriaceae bacterium]|nr:hypothetical protein [Propionibacteriaceae bacterium]